ncbi:MAG: hypothetical protein DDT40_00351 [candidate division WS2 bacterium]|uniref:Uncharacterized protein n=1 Tax=Psychracetigena formicireducens TaxID=2986056 RepID=A0A9E2F0Y9_PSYF1|nr:hypothetical protein [Candidatus Psychracetigena formicireducens]MBT9144899.1 hypothetical protein [Candidatus Psychracetigena formicireducens]MBT9150184.1 hypothetical protein [Candidatus Psychracetigena formicireducens]
METLVWLFIYLVFVIVSAALTSNKRRRKTTPSSSTYRREPPILLKSSPGKETKTITSRPETTIMDSTYQRTELEILSSAETEGGLLTALPLTKDAIITGIIFREILGPPKSLQRRRKRF